MTASAAVACARPIHCIRLVCGRLPIAYAAYVNAGDRRLSTVAAGSGPSDSAPSASPGRRAARIAETTARLVAAARRAFAAEGYAEASMDALCAEAGLTRGALYHHFGGKEGLLEAVVLAIDAEIGARLDAAAAAETDPWSGFRACCGAWLDLALEPEIQRILLRDAPAVLGQRLREIDERSSIRPMVESLRALMAGGRIRPADPEALARMLNGAMVDAALWIAAHDDPPAGLARARSALDALLDGLAA
jgi:AcrR family transcriptional regulator